MKDTKITFNYLRSRGVAGPWKISGAEGEGFMGAVVIPSLAESDSLFATLDSLAGNPSDLLSRFLVLVVVNNRTGASSEEKCDNQVTLERLSKGFPRLRLAWVDASTEGNELPEKGGGVGLARKIGFDLALSRLNFSGCNPILIALDADTLVGPHYLESIVSHFSNAETGGAVIPFRHRVGSSSMHTRAINRYELFLRCYVQGLSRADSPYGFHTVGSAMACTAEAYVKAGGMNTRVAGEDFYFLQQLHKTVGVSQVSGTVVFPSARASDRVPFGTGRSVGRLLSGDRDAVLFYDQRCFQILHDWLSLVRSSQWLPGDDVLRESSKISIHLHEYLQLIRFPEVWNRLCLTCPDSARLSSAFDVWFDALKTMKLIHHLSAAAFPRLEPEDAVPSLFKWAGLDTAGDIEEHLAALRKIQIGCV